MVLNIHISPEAEAALKSKADAAGVDMATYAARQLELMVQSRRAVGEMSEPSANGLPNSGISEEELADFLEDEKHQMRRERRSKKVP